MAQPAELDALREALASLYRDAQASIDARVAAITADPDELARRYRLERRLRQLSAEVELLADTLDAQARRWLSSRFPDAYALGGAAAAATTGRPFGWAQVHVEAVNELAADAYDDLLAATRFMRRDAKAFIREAARGAARLSIVEGDTAHHAGRALARELAERGIAAVRYSNGARHTIATYAEMAVRTKTAQAYNAGTINQARTTGVEYFECNDGPDCGLVSHDDAEKVNGRVYPAAVAMAHSIAHPNCARSWGPRPDITAAGDAERARRFSPDEQERMAAEERARARAQVAKRAERRRRTVARQRRLAARQARLTARAASRT